MKEVAQDYTEPYIASPKFAELLHSQWGALTGRAH